jgi:hypothetical protein
MFHDLADALMVELSPFPADLAADCTDGASKFHIDPRNPRHPRLFLS